MQTRSKVVEFGEKKFEIRRLPPEVGSFIFMRMLGVSMRSTVDQPQRQQASEQPVQSAEAEKVTGAMRVRALTFAVFSGSISFEDFKFIQASCLKSVSVIEDRAGNALPMPVLLDNGEYSPSGEDLAYDVGLVMKLTTEVLIFCFADFFDEGGTPGL